MTQALLSGDDSWVPAEPIGTRIAKRRHVLDLSQRELAERIGVSRDTVSMWERNKQYPHRHLGKLEAVLGVNLTAGPGEFEPRDEFEREILATGYHDAENLIRLYREHIASGGRAKRAG